MTTFTYSKSIVGTMKRARFSIICAIMVLTIYYFIHQRRPAPTIPPMPGTYQYFLETDFHSNTKRFGAVSHCDTRFAPKQAPEIEEVRRSLDALLKSYIATMTKLSVETWMAHGTLLGWYWNRKFLPWDTDLDVHVSADGIASLATFYNMTEYNYSPSEGEPLRTYLLDINPHYLIVSNEDVANKIDGRWIDTTNGKFIDITAVHQEEADTRKRASSNMFCKDGHRYEYGDIYPLQSSVLENVEVSVPVENGKILGEEYGVKALTNDRFHWHRFNHKTKIWEPE